jgi:hypothetical protein
MAKLRRHPERNRGPQRHVFVAGVGSEGTLHYEEVGTQRFFAAFKINHLMEPIHSRDSEITTQSRHSRRIRQRREIIAAAVVLLALLIAIPPLINVNRFRHTILHSISAGLGRPVEASAIGLQVFPRPGFVLHNLSVGEDPAYGAEPVMTAETVTAGLRASTLWHARVEIATLRFDAPSVNLVRNPNGKWNFESLLRNSPALHLHGASTAQKSGGRLPFPYIEATEARINFKFGAEKLPFSLERANLAVWKESTREWRVRIRANPVRTDLTSEDAGQIRGEGTLTTGGPLMNAPVRASLEWRRVQLGEISRLLYGADNGWRGTVDWTAHAQGTLSDVSLNSDIAIEEFHRAEFMPALEMDLAAHCVGRYARYQAEFDSIACDAPSGGGHIWLRGFAAVPLNASRNKDLVAPEPALGLPKSLDSATRASSRKKIVTAQIDHRPAAPPVEIAAQNVSAGFFLDLLRHIHPAVDPDASVSGMVNGEADCAWSGLHIPQSCTGQLRATEVRLSLPHLEHSLALSSLLLTSSSSASSPIVWTIAPMRVSLGAASPVSIIGTMDGDGATLQVAGPADLSKLATLAQSLRIPAFSGQVQSLHGNAQLALVLATGWIASPDQNAAVISPASAAPSPAAGLSRWSGSVQLHNATFKLAVLPLPIELTTGRIELTDSGMEWTALNGTFAHIPFDGSIRWQIPCATEHAACARSFTLHTTTLNTGHLQTALRNGVGGTGLFDRINPWAGATPQLPDITGTFQADVVSAGKLSIRNASLQLHLKGQTAELNAISGKVFGGTVAGQSAEAKTIATGSAHWGNDAPAYTLRVALTHIQPDKVSAVWDEHWGGGTADATLDLHTQGWSAQDLAKNANGNFTVDWMNGILIRSSGAATTTDATTASPLDKFERWTAKGTLGNKTLQLDSSRLTPQIAPPQKGLVSPVPQSVTGTITFDRTLDLHLTPSGIAINGPLDNPVESSPK